MGIINFLLLYAMAYPMFMSIFWSIGALAHYFFYERSFNLTFNERPLVSVLVPCYNEAENVEEIIYRLSSLNYENYEIIAIDDGSTDLTGVKLKYIAQNNEKVRVIVSKQNRGKANALHLGFIAARGDYLVCVDADAYLDSDAINYLIPHFLSENNGQKIAAVTGNPQVRNRNSLLAKIQVAEFSSIVGSIKRAQRMGGLVMTVSGVVVCYSKRALLDVDLWDKDMITEDIAVTWKFHQQEWEIIYEPRAICWMLVPEKIGSLWSQRVRWAEGGVEVLFRHFTQSIKHIKFPSLLLIEQILGIIWAYIWILNIIIMLVFKQVPPHKWFQSYFLEIICLVQFSVAMCISYKHDSTLLRELKWIIWYPLIYWYFNAFCVAYAFIKTIFKPKDSFAKWDSPDRGISKTSTTTINENIAAEVDLEINIKDTYKSSFIYGLELFITALLWIIFAFETYKIVNFILFNNFYFNITPIHLLLNSDYAFYIIAYIVSFILAVSLLIYFYLASRIRRLDKLKPINIDVETSKYFKLSHQELQQLQQANTQVFDNKELEKRKNLR